MSTECEILPFLGPSCFKNQLSILVVSSNRLFRETLSKALYEIHLCNNYQWQLSVHTCTDISSILGQLSKLGAISIDFIIICMDTSTLHCIDWTEEIIKQCDSDLRLGRMILVNGSGLPTLEMAVSLDSITTIKRKYNLQLLNGNLGMRSEADCIAKRVHIIIDTVMGVRTGLPHVVNFTL